MIRLSAITLIVCCLMAAPPIWGQIVLRQAQELPGRYIVEFEVVNEAAFRLKQDRVAGINQLKHHQAARIARLREAMTGTDLQVLRDLWLRQSVAVSVSDTYLSRLRQLSFVAEVRAERRFRVETQGVTTLPESGETVQDNLARIDIDSIWAEGYRGQGIVIAILDSGMDPLHADLVDRWRGGDNSWFDAYGQHDQPKDLTGHGTAVGSIVLGGNASGSFIGVAPNALWIAGRIFDDSGNSIESAISETLQWVVDPDGNPATDDFPDIVHNSWGLDASEGSCINPFTAELAAINALGIDIVFSVGNSGISGPGPGGFSSYLTPAFDPNAISVGAIRADDNLLFNSSRGPDICGSAVIPSVVAPGEFIKTAQLTFEGFDPDNTALNSGTSFSAPHVSGALALLRSKYQADDFILYRNALFDTSTDLGDQNDYGRGVIQTAAAMDQLQTQSVPLRSNEVGFASTDYRFDETSSNARISVVRSGDITTAASIDIQSEDLSATVGDDYQAVAGTINFSPGESIKFIDIDLIDDTLGEAEESFDLILSQNVNVNLGTRNRVAVRILDDETAVVEEELGGSTIGLVELSVLLSAWAGRRLRS